MRRIVSNAMIVLIGLSVLPALLFAQEAVPVDGGYIKDGTLVCYTGYFKTKTGCSRAPLNGWASGDTWGCNSGYVKGSLQCILGTQVISDGMYCNDGYVSSHGQCLHADQAYANDTCVARYGPNATGKPLYDKDVECVCRSNFYWNSAETACITAEQLKDPNYARTAYVTPPAVTIFTPPLSDAELNRRSIVAQLNALLLEVDKLQKRLAALKASRKTAE